MSDPALPAVAWPVSLSLAALGLLLGLGGIMVWTYTADLLETRAAVADRSAELELLQKAISRRLGDKAQAPDAGSQRSPYLTGETETIAAAELQTLVLKLVEATPASVLSAQVRPKPVLDAATAADKGDRQVDFELAFDARMADFQSILFAIETDLPAVFVDEMQLQPAKAALPGEAVDLDPLMHVVLTMHAYWRG